MKVLVTGGAGFIGCRLIGKIMSERDWDVVSLDSLGYSGNLNRIDAMLPDYGRLKIVYHDLRSELNYATMKMIGDVDMVVHMAAKPHVDHSISDPLSTVMHNVVGTCNILNFARDVGVGNFIYFGTDEVFGPAAAGQSFDEYSRYNSRSPYSASKAGAEELVSSFFHSYKLPAKVIHCNNVYGESQQSGAFIPICIRKISRGEELTIHSDEKMEKIPTRRYIYVEDVADAVIKVAERGDSTCVIDGNPLIPKYNITSDEELSILEIARKISASMGKELKYSLSPTARVGLDTRYDMRGDRLKDLGWRQTRFMDDMLPAVVEWYLKNDEWL